MRFDATWTPSVAVDGPYETVALTGYWYRLIPSRFPTIDIYRRVAPRELWPLAAAIETMTNPRVRLKERVTAGCEHDRAIPPRLQNWNHAPFSYRNPLGTHLLPDSHSILELADSVQTALAVAIRKRERFLSAAKLPLTDVEMRVLKHEVAGRFTDLCDLAPDMPREERWALGQTLFGAGSAGARFRCPDRPSGLRLAVFDPGTLGPAVQTQHFKFHWDGKRIGEIYNYRDDNDGKPLLADDIFGGHLFQV